MDELVSNKRPKCLRFLCFFDKHNWLEFPEPEKHKTPIYLARVCLDCGEPRLRAKLALGLSLESKYPSLLIAEVEKARKTSSRLMSKGFTLLDLLLILAILGVLIAVILPSLGLLGWLG